jgi:hypothetical protein
MPAGSVFAERAAHRPANPPWMMARGWQKSDACPDPGEETFQNLD